MNHGDETQTTPAAPFGAETATLRGSTTDAENGIAADPPFTPAAELEKDPVQPCDFRTRMLLSPVELRKLRMHQEEFASSLAARLSLYLRLDFLLKLKSVQTVAYGKLAQGWQNATHLTLFKIEPLRGISVLEIPLPLGSSIVDRLMGGPGEPTEIEREVSEIENALLDQAIQKLILGEWCSQWTKFKELKPALLGCETSGKFVQAAVPETIMLVITLDAQIGSCTGQIQIAFPYNSLEALIRELSRGVESEASESTPQVLVKPACKWNPCFDDVCIPAVAEWQGIEMTTREVLALKIGDVLKVTGKDALNVKLRLADAAKFNGRLGTVDGTWAVELTEVIKR